MLVRTREWLRRILHRLLEPQQRQNRQLIPYDAETAFARERTLSKSQRKRFREFRPAPPKCCTFAGCGGNMTCRDAHWPYAVRWQCDRDDVHRELVMTLKDCVVVGCRGTMRWIPHDGIWTCERDFKHRQLEPQPYKFKYCAVSGCRGIMHRRRPGMWTCTQDSSHREPDPLSPTPA